MTHSISILSCYISRTLVVAAFLMSVSPVPSHANSEVISVIPFLLDDAGGTDPSTLLNDFTTERMTFFTYSGGGAELSVGLEVVSDTDVVARPNQVGDESVLKVDADITTGWGGLGDQGTWDFTNVASFDFWMRGTNSGGDFAVELQSGGSNANSIRATVVDDFSGWRLVQVPLSSFSAQNGVYVPSDTTAWIFVLDGFNSLLYFDDVGFTPN